MEMSSNRMASRQQLVFAAAMIETTVKKAMTSQPMAGKTDEDMPSWFQSCGAEVVE